MVASSAAEKELRDMINKVEHFDSEDEITPKEFKVKMTLGQKMTQMVNLEYEEYEKTKQDRLHNLNSLNKIVSRLIKKGLTNTATQTNESGS